MTILDILRQKFEQALAGLTDEPAKYAALIKPTQDARHGDYQANCAMPLAKVLGGKKPPEVAREIVARLDLGDLLEPPEVAGPGFINLRLKTSWLARQVQAMAQGDRLGVAQAEKPRTIVIDFSSPNVAKPMHVGHLRSTIIGAALARLLRFLGHHVITDNHLGDWGTQFGMLLYGYKHFRNEEALKRDPVQELARLYVHVRGLFKKGDEDEADATDPVKEACRQETAKLHAGDPENVALWRQFMPWCYEELEAVYRRLGVSFDHTHGESFYQPMLAGVVDDLLARGVAYPSQGAVVIPPPGIDPARWLAEQSAPPAEGEERRQGPPPALIRKRDGAFTYTTSDLATIKYRMETWHPDAILYVVGKPQELHFRALFDAARRWGYDAVELQHIAFGSVLSGGGKMLKTRAGNAPPLDELLDAAIGAAKEVFERLRQEALARGEEVPEFSEEELKQIHEIVGLGAVKYADLSQNRESDYRFDPEKMTATDGNTATYMQYAYVRNRGIFRKGEVDEQALRANPPLPELGTPQERALALALVRFGEALEAAAADYRPSQITAYLWDLSKTYSGFFVHCPVLKAETPALRQSRLLLCDLTARVIQRGLDLLGIRTVERM